MAKVTLNAGQYARLGAWLALNRETLDEKATQPEIATMATEALGFTVTQGHIQRAEDEELVAPHKKARTVRRAALVDRLAKIETRIVDVAQAVEAVTGRWFDSQRAQAELLDALAGRIQAVEGRLTPPPPARPVAFDPPESPIDTPNEDGERPPAHVRTACTADTVGEGPDLFEV